MREDHTMTETTAAVKTVPATIKAIKEFFGLRPGDTLKSFTAEWASLTDTDKEHIRTGIGNGSLTY
jgi:hypothetical protein